MSDDLIAELDVDTVTIEWMMGGWEVVFHLSDGETLGHWIEQPDPLHDQLIEKGYIE